MLFALQGVASFTPEETICNLVEEVYAFTEGTPQRDDLTVLALRYTGPDPR